MPIQTVRYIDKQLTVHVATGSITADEIKDALEHFYSSNPSLNVLWDIRNATWYKLTQHHIEAIITFVSARKDRRKNGKTAIIAPMDLDFGIGRVFEALYEVEKVNFKVRTFRDKEAAFAWLAIPSLNLESRSGIPRETLAASG